jgi:hypothetical protein
MTIGCKAFMVGLAGAQPTEDPIRSLRLAQQSVQNPYERAQEVIRRLDLPPDPTLKTKMDQAFAAQNTCLKDAMPPLMKKGLRNSALAAAACRSCEKQVISAAKIWFDANKHRYMEPNLEADIKHHQQDCPLSALTLALTAPDQVMERTAVLAVGSWRVEGQLSYDGLLSYTLASKDRSSGVALELRCEPISDNLVLYLRGPYKKAASGQDRIYMTYSIDRDSPKQIEGLIQSEGEIVLPRNASRAAGTLWSAIQRTREALFVSASTISARFSAEGYQETEREWVRRCAH